MNDIDDLLEIGHEKAFNYAYDRDERREKSEERQPMVLVKRISGLLWSAKIGGTINAVEVTYHGAYEGQSVSVIAGYANAIGT